MGIVANPVIISFLGFFQIQPSVCKFSRRKFRSTRMISRVIVASVVIKINTRLALLMICPAGTPDKMNANWVRNEPATATSKISIKAVTSWKRVPASTCFVDSFISFISKPILRIKIKIGNRAGYVLDVI